MTNREPRRKVSISARMRAETGWSDVLIQNMSSRGLMGRSRNIQAHGTILEIRRANHVIVGRVVWSKDGSFGVRTADPIDVDSVVSADRNTRRSAKDPANERRRQDRPTRASVAVKAERSRSFARAFQFAVLALACIGGAGAAGYAVWHVVAAPVQQAEASLAGR